MEMDFRDTGGSRLGSRLAARRCWENGISDETEDNSITEVVQRGGFRAPPREHPRDRLIRWSAFLGLVGLAMLILAGVVWLPDIARVRQLDHQRACQELRVREADATVAAMDRLIARTPTDEVLTKRLAWSKLGLLPSNEAWPQHTSVPPPPSPGTLSPIRFSDPPPPNAAIDRWALKVQSPAYRRGLLVLAGCMIVAAMLLFPAPRTE